MVDAVGVRVGLWLVGYAALVGGASLLGLGDEFEDWIGDLLALTAAYGCLLGLWVRRWWVCGVPLAAAAVVGVIRSIGYEGEDSLTMLIVNAELFLGIAPMLGCIFGVVVPRKG